MRNLFKNFSKKNPQEENSLLTALLKEEAGRQQQQQGQERDVNENRSNDPAAYPEHACLPYPSNHNASIVEYTNDYIIGPTTPLDSAVPRVTPYSNHHLNYHRGPLPPPAGPSYHHYYSNGHT